jgi:hypothetical protein
MSLEMSNKAVYEAPEGFDAEERTHGHAMGRLFFSGSLPPGHLHL